MKTYGIVIAGDDGIRTLRVTAATKKRAIQMVMEVKQLPAHAILTVQALNSNAVLQNMVLLISAGKRPTFVETIPQTA